MSWLNSFRPLVASVPVQSKEVILLLWLHCLPLLSLFVGFGFRPCFVVCPFYFCNTLTEREREREMVALF